MKYLNIIIIVILLGIVGILIFQPKFIDTENSNIEVEKSDVSYEVTFHSTWTNQTHPNQYPSNSHFSPIVVVSHNGNEKIFENGIVSSGGIEYMAETGATRKLSNEINQIINSRNALNFAIGNVIFLNQVNKTDPVIIKVSENYSKITAVSMIAPSPDWFVAIKDIELYENGEWKPNSLVNVIAYDAGTDSGVTFNSQNKATNPKKVIKIIDDGPLTENGFVQTMGYFFFERI